MVKKITNVTHVVRHFSGTGNLQKHIDAVHNSKKDHKCESCTKAFSEPEDHKCDLCGKAFSQSGQLKKHIKAIHNGQKDNK